jgi:hypothetical protein
VPAVASRQARATFMNSTGLAMGTEWGPLSSPLVIPVFCGSTKRGPASRSSALVTCPGVPTAAGCWPLKRPSEDGVRGKAAEAGKTYIYWSESYSEERLDG